MCYTSCWRRRPSQHGRGVVAVAVAVGQWQALSVGYPYVGVMTVLPHITSILQYLYLARSWVVTSGWNKNQSQFLRPLHKWHGACGTTAPVEWGRNIKDGDGPIPILP